MNFSEEALRMIKKYSEKGRLGHTSMIFAAIASTKHKKVKTHLEITSVLADIVSAKLQKDRRATFFSTFLHDIGKLALPYYLFDGRDVTKEEFKLIKEHAVIGFIMMKDIHPFTALCIGFHHNLYEGGYGITLKDFPKVFAPATIRKALNIAANISICDFIESFNRGTILKHHLDRHSKLRDILRKQYINDHLIIDVALSVGRELGIVKRREM